MPLIAELECSCPGLFDDDILLICARLEEFSDVLEAKVRYGLDVAPDRLELSVTLTDQHEHDALLHSAVVFFEVLLGREITGTILRLIRE